MKCGPRAEGETELMAGMFLLGVEVRCLRRAGAANGSYALRGADDPYWKFAERLRNVGLLELADSELEYSLTALGRRVLSLLTYRGQSGCIFIRTSDLIELT